MKHPLPIQFPHGNPQIVVAQLVPWLVVYTCVDDKHPCIGYRRILGKADFQ
jgi:hypothetical protein